VLLRGYPRRLRRVKERVRGLDTHESRDRRHPVLGTRVLPSKPAPLMFARYPAVAGDPQAFLGLWTAGPYVREPDTDLDGGYWR
jgi:hypothetical protein